METTEQISVSKVIDVLKEFLLEKKNEIKTITEKTDIYTEFGLDDLDIMELAMELEDEFKTNINDEEITLITESTAEITPIVLTELVNKSLTKKD